MPYAARKSNAPAFQLTRFTNQNNEPLTKSIALGPDGKPVSAAAAQMWAGTAEPIEAEGLAGVAEIIDTCAASQCLSLGEINSLWRPDAGKTVPVVTKRNWEGNPGAITRSAACLSSRGARALPRRPRSKRNFVACRRGARFFRGRYRRLVRDILRTENGRAH